MRGADDKEGGPMSLFNGTWIRRLLRRVRLPVREQRNRTPPTSEPLPRNRRMLPRALAFPATQESDATASLCTQHMRYMIPTKVVDLCTWIMLERAFQGRFG